MTPLELLSLFVDSGDDYHAKWEAHQAEHPECDPEGLCKEHWAAMRDLMSDLNKLRTNNQLDGWTLDRLKAQERENLAWRALAAFKENKSKWYPPTQIAAGFVTTMVFDAQRSSDVFSECIAESPGHAVVGLAEKLGLIGALPTKPKQEDR